jgi:SAM-dependent methyltransferase
MDAVNATQHTPDPRSDEVVETTRATYDDVAAMYADANREVPDSVRESLERFLVGLPARAIVADVGCGPGRDLAQLRARGVRAFGFDLSWGMLRSGAATGVVQTNMTKLPVGTAALDGIWCAAAFLHVPRELGAKALSEFARAVRSGGVLHLSVAEGNAEGIERARYGVSGDLWVVQREESELRHDLGSVGFTVTSVNRSESHRRWITLGAVRVGS